MTEPGGSVAAGFEPVFDAFERTLEGSSGGAAFAAFVDGEPVVDLWGGDADAGGARPWDEDTLVLLFSGTKGVVASCMLLLLERGQLELDAPVARYWDGFGATEVLVRHVLAHTAGLPGLQPPFVFEEALDPVAMEDAIARQTPFWPPGSCLAYHALTFGWLCDGLLRRVDGRSTGRFVAEELAGPLGLELWIGLPDEQEPRVAELVAAPGYGITYLGDEPEPLLACVYGERIHEFPWNDRRVHEAEIPAANGIATARSVARLYSRLGSLLSADVLALAHTELSRDLCAVTRRPYAYGAGFELQTGLGRFGPAEDAFGHTGSGGSTHGAWPSRGVAFSYAMSELRTESEDDRGPSVLRALYEAL